MSAVFPSVTLKEPVRKPALHRREGPAEAQRRTAEAVDFASRGIRPKGEGENRRP